MSSLSHISIANFTPSADCHGKSSQFQTSVDKNKQFGDHEMGVINRLCISFSRQLKARRLRAASGSKLGRKVNITVASAGGVTRSKPDTNNGAANGGAGRSSRVGVNGVSVSEKEVNGSFKSRMVPIEEAMKFRESPQKKQPMSTASFNGVKGSSIKEIPYKAQNGALTESSKNQNGSVLAQRQVVKADEKRKQDVSLIPRSATSLRAPAQSSFGTDSMKVLPSDEGFSWSKENYSKLQRTIDVWSFVLSLRVQLYFIDTKWSYPGGFTEEKQKIRRRRTAAWVRESILQLGPTFIKLGQLSSTRSDLFPAEFVEELSKLQDRVPAFSSQKAKYFIRQELGESVDVLFSEFEEQPIAAASLGQVHRALLSSGERVVVKVQRPGLKELFDIDLSNLKVISEFFQNSETLGGPTRDWIGIYEECASILYQEIDYINEGRNADRFRRNFRNIKWVRVPTIYWDYTSRKVLTLEYVPGIKINQVDLLDAGCFNRSEIAQRSIEAYLIQILKTGFFHADPHPGNLAVDIDGSLIYYDFGMMGEIKSFTREKLLEMFYSVYEKDASKVIQALIDLGALLPTGDMGSVRRSVQFFLNNLTNPKPDQATTFSAIGEDLFAIAVDQPFRFPATFTFVLRAFSTLEGIGYVLDPNFSFTKVAAPYAQELLDVRNSQKNSQYLVQELQKQAFEARDATVAIPSRVQHIDEFIRQLEAGDVKLRVRVLEAERAARKATVMQMATINTVAAATLLNIGVTLTTQGLTTFATPSYIGAGIFSILVLNGMKRIQRLEKFETMVK